MAHMRSAVGLPHSVWVRSGVRSGPDIARFDATGAGRLHLGLWPRRDRPPRAPRPRRRGGTGSTHRSTGSSEHLLDRHRVGGALQPVPVDGRVEVAVGARRVGLVVDDGQAVGSLDEQVDEAFEDAAADRRAHVQLPPVARRRPPRCARPRRRARRGPGARPRPARSATPSAPAWPRASSAEVGTGGQVDDLQHGVHRPPDGGAGPSPPRADASAASSAAGRRASLGQRRSHSSAAPSRASSADAGGGDRAGPGRGRSSRAARSSDPPLALGARRPRRPAETGARPVGRVATGSGRVDGRGSAGRRGGRADGRGSAPRSGSSGIRRRRSGPGAGAWLLVVALRWRLTTRWSRARVAAT